MIELQTQAMREMRGAIKGVSVKEVLVTSG